MRLSHGALAVFAAVMLHASVSAAQARSVATAPLAPHPTAAPLLPAGVYELTLTPATGDARPLTGAVPIALSAQVSNNGPETTITTSDGMTLQGASSPTHLKASGPVHGATLTLEVGGSATQASGTWLLRGGGTHEVTGTVSIAPAPRYRTHTAKQGGCSGFFDCVSQITGYTWKTIFG